VCTALDLNQLPPLFYRKKWNEEKFVLKIANVVFFVNFMKGRVWPLYKIKNVEDSYTLNFM